MLPKIFDTLFDIKTVAELHRLMKTYQAVDDEDDEVLLEELMSKHSIPFPKNQSLTIPAEIILDMWLKKLAKSTKP